MKRWIVLAILVVGISSAATLAVQFLPGPSSQDAGPAFPVSGETPGKHPKAVVEGEPTFAFGTMPQRAVGKHAWVVRNKGETDLEIAMLSSTCSCTLAKFKDGKKAIVKPGDSTEIELEFETRENNGAYEKGATIGTNDPELPSFDLHVRGMVYPAVMTFPPDQIVNFSSISNDADDHLAHIAIYSKDRPETKITAVSTSKPKEILATFKPLTSEESKEIKVEKGQKLTINVKSGLPLGLFREEVVVTTDHPKQSEVNLTVTGRMSGPINLLPTHLELHRVNGKTGGSGDMIVTVRGGRETKFEVDSVPKNLQVAIAPIDAVQRKGRYRLTVTVPPGTPAQAIESEIVLKTDHPKAEKVIVPIDILIQNVQ
jgi:hypothetical protein